MKLQKKMITFAVIAPVGEYLAAGKRETDEQTKEGFERNASN